MLVEFIKVAELVVLVVSLLLLVLKLGIHK